MRSSNLLLVLGGAIGMASAAMPGVRFYNVPCWADEKNSTVLYPQFEQ